MFMASQRDGAGQLRVGNDASSAKERLREPAAGRAADMKPEQFPKGPIPIIRHRIQNPGELLEEHREPERTGNINLYTERAPCYSYAKSLNRSSPNCLNMEVRVYPTAMGK